MDVKVSIDNMENLDMPFSRKDVGNSFELGNLPTAEADTVNFLKQSPARESTLRQEYDLAHSVL